MANSVNFDVEKLAADMAAKGWKATDLARKADVSDMAVSRFFRREAKNPRTVKKLAKALGYSVRRYILESVRAVA